ncbi:MAG: site-2 protease family protein [Campylobacterales bacterium]|nr:site-2 protease family protein [Campylobacterales bacterium]
MTLELEIVKIIAIILALLLAIIGHEIMHGWTAYRFGDSTAKSLGRLSINPIKHIDPIGSVVLPGFLFVVGSPFLFGWAKPVPVNMHTVIANRGTNGAIGVALAGISYNFTLMTIFAFIYSIMGEPSSLLGIFVSIFIVQSIIINAALGFFNLWPIPPLDGSQALRYFAMGKKWYGFVAWMDKIYPYGMFILIAIIASGAASYLFKPLLWLLAQIL